MRSTLFEKRLRNRRRDTLPYNAERVANGIFFVEGGCLDSIKLNHNAYVDWWDSVVYGYVSCTNVFYLFWCAATQCSMCATILFLYLSRCSGFRIGSAVAVRWFSSKSLHKYAINMFMNRGLFSVSTWAGVSKGTIQWLRATFAKCVAIALDVRFHFVINKYRSLITMTNTFPFFVHDRGPRMFIAIN